MQSLTGFLFWLVFGFCGVGRATVFFPQGETPWTGAQLDRAQIERFKFFLSEATAKKIKNEDFLKALSEDYPLDFTFVPSLGPNPLPYDRTSLEKVLKQISLPALRFTARLTEKSESGQKRGLLIVSSQSSLFELARESLRQLFWESEIEASVIPPPIAAHSDLEKSILEYEALIRVDAYVYRERLDTYRLLVSDFELPEPLSNLAIAKYRANLEKLEALLKSAHAIALQIAPLNASETQTSSEFLSRFQKAQRLFAGLRKKVVNDQWLKSRTATNIDPKTAGDLSPPPIYFRTLPEGIYKKANSECEFAIEPVLTSDDSVYLAAQRMAPKGMSALSCQRYFKWARCDRKQHCGLEGETEITEMNDRGFRGVRLFGSDSSYELKQD